MATAPVSSLHAPGQQTRRIPHLLLLLLLAPWQGFAQAPQPPVLDQSQTTGGWSAGGLDQWQSFTAGKSGALVQIDLHVRSGLVNQPQNGTIRIYKGEGISGQLLATQEVTFQYIHNEFQSFQFSAPATLQAGQQYSYRFSIPNITVGWVTLNITNPYAGGRASHGPDADYLFRTYVRPNAPAEGSWKLGTFLNQSERDVSFSLPVRHGASLTGNPFTALQTVGILIPDLGVLGITYRGHNTPCLSPFWGARINFGERAWEFYFDTGTELNITLQANGSFTFLPGPGGQVVNADVPPTCLR